MNRKLFSLPSLIKQLTCLRRAKKKIVFTNGCFDILHAGHVDYLETAKRAGDFLVVGLNSDSSVRRLKGPDRPVNSEKDRARVLGGLSAVDAIVIFSADTPQRLILSVKPDVLVKGADWKVSNIVGASDVLSWGGSVRRIRFLKGRSTSRIIHKIKTKD